MEVIKYDHELYNNNIKINWCFIYRQCHNYSNSNGSKYFYLNILSMQRITMVSEIGRDQLSG